MNGLSFLTNFTRLSGGQVLCYVIFNKYYLLPQRKRTVGICDDYSIAIADISFSKHDDSIVIVREGLISNIKKKINWD